MNIDEQFSTIVVGTTLSGILCALHASEAGSVLLVNTPNSASCQALLSETATKTVMKYGAMPYSAFDKPESMSLRYFDWDHNVLKTTSAKFANVNEEVLRNWLMGKLSSNVTFVGNLAFKSCWQDMNGVTANFAIVDDQGKSSETVTLKCDYLVGCDGADSAIRASLPVSQPQKLTVVQSTQAVRKATEPFFDFICARGLGDGFKYSWASPKEGNLVMNSVVSSEAKDATAMHRKAVTLFSSYYPYDIDAQECGSYEIVSAMSSQDFCEGYGRVLLAGQSSGICSIVAGAGLDTELNAGIFAGTAIAMAASGEASSSFEGEQPSESEALWLYKEAQSASRRSAVRRLAISPLANSNAGKLAADYLPKPLINAISGII